MDQWVNVILLLIKFQGLHISHGIHFLIIFENWSSLFLGTQELRHWGQDKMAAIIQTTFSNAFSWMKIYEFRLRFQLTIFQYWLRLWLGAGEATSHYLNNRWLSLLTHICIAWPQWVKMSAILNWQPKWKNYESSWRFCMSSIPGVWPLWKRSTCTRSQRSDRWGRWWRGCCCLLSAHDRWSAVWYQGSF